MISTILIVLIFFIIINEVNAWWFINKYLYRKNPLQNLRIELNNRLISQDIAKRQVYRTISDWYNDRRSALIIPIGGPSRTGKTLAARIVRESLFEIDSPCYKSVSMSTMPFESSRKIREYVINGIKECPGLNLFVFDEIQSQDSKIFQSLNDVFDERGYITVDVNTNERLNTSNSIFIFITDITESVFDIIKNNKFEFQDQIELRKAINKKLEISNSGLPFTRHMKKPIVFYPFYKSDLKSIINVYLKEINSRQSIYTSVSKVIISYIIDPKNGVVGYNERVVDGKTLFIASDSFADAKSAVDAIIDVSNGLSKLIPSSSTNTENKKYIYFDMKEKAKVNAEIKVEGVSTKGYSFTATITDLLNGDVDSFQKSF